ncbi:hypothetical protein [Pseudoxanthomonas sp. CF125]|uniref:hypothetical protein n=1 Tax=Pseudoxanthomonas sp. CF125 TaxID=1855303 RepID=UPI00088E39DB|nr:hypothetical protein [Pseudoxanthomonas sp. CF125]SDR10631.1 hypothetical protein SAMN05216569_3122 [Pseudoxanthomonas sp. CF125]
MATSDRVLLDLTGDQQAALQHFGLEVAQVSVNAKTGAAQLVRPRKPGLVRLTTEQTKALKKDVTGAPEIAGFETNPKTFGIDLISVADSRKIKAMWGEGGE